MKSFLIAAVLVLASSPVRAAYEAGAVAADVSGRGELLQEMETWRATQLAHAPQKTFRVYGPRLKAIKNRVAVAADEAGLVQPKKDFEAWKTGLLREKFAQAQASGMAGGRDFASYRQAQSLSAGMMDSVRAQTELAAVDGARAFDGALLSSGGADAVAAPAPLALNDPARYAKVRGIMIAQGVKTKIVDAAIKESLRQGVDPSLVLNVIWQESRGKARATSRVGARGLMQIMPGTGREMGIKPGRLYDVKTNLRAGIGYLKYAAKYLKLDVDLSDIAEVPANKIKALLASYNAGIGNVSKWLRKQGGNLTRIPFAETRHYVKAIGDQLALLAKSPAW